jgi:predicted RNase H-like nuclease (RuvC/YqgF family)
MATIINTQQNQIQFLKDENSQLKMIIRDQSEKIEELEFKVNPWSPNGDAICNSKFD